MSEASKFGTRVKGLRERKGWTHSNLQIIRAYTGLLSLTWKAVEGLL